MKKQWDEKEHKNAWMLLAWYEKTIYVWGWVAFGFMVIAFGWY